MVIDAVVKAVRSVFVIAGAVFLVTFFVHAFGGPCLLPQSIICKVEQK